MFPSIVADIGGTNSRFSLVTGKEPVGQHNAQFVIEHTQILQGANYASLQDALAAYIDTLEGIKPFSACIAIAGPVQSDVVKMTNLPWSFSQRDVCKQFGFHNFIAINDYTAAALATTQLQHEGLHSVIAGKRVANANKAVLGAGTGLGVAGLAYTPKRWVPIPSEGGHVNMAPADAYEADVIKALMKRFDYVSAETCVSGPGFVNLYNAIADVTDTKAETLKPKDITQRAIDGSDELCRETLDVFCGFLATVSSNLALTYSATGGVYIGGGIAPRFPEYIANSQRFKARFHQKGAMNHFVQDIPVDVITYEKTAFLGAAAWLEQTIIND